MAEGDAFETHAGFKPYNLFSKQFQYLVGLPSKIFNEPMFQSYCGPPH